MISDPSRRLAVAVVCDVDRSTELRMQLGDHRADRLFERLQRSLRAAATREGALGMASTGDGMWAVLPSAAAGLAAALGLSHASSRLAQRSGVGFTVRIGVAAGDIRFDEHDARGLAMAQAARLMQGAAPGEILVSEAVTLLTRRRRSGVLDFSFGSPSPLALRGFDEPLSACQLRVAAPDLRSEVGPPTWGRDHVAQPLVGRSAELGQLDEIVKRSMSGPGEVVVVQGPAGIGKTSLAVDFARSIAERGVAVLGGRCQEDGSDPYQPLVEAFERVVVAHPGWIAQVSDDCLAPELVALSPVFATLPRSTAPFRPLDAHTGQARLHHAVIRLLQGLAQIEPILLLIDDIQWATPSTCQLLDALVRALRADHNRDGGLDDLALGSGITIILTCRSAPTQSGAQPDVPPSLAEVVAGASTIALAGLDEEAVEDLARAALGSEAYGAVWSPRRLVEATAGNPLFVTEVLRASSLGKAGASASLARFVNVELARLGSHAVRVAQCVSVDPAGVEPFAVRLAAQLASNEFELAAAATIAGGVLAEAVSGEQLRLVFRHDVVREAVESSLTQNGRAELKAAIADAIESAAAPGTRDVFRLAEHRLVAAGLGRKDLVRSAYTACQAAADDASRRAAHLDAARWYQSAGNLARLLGDEVSLDEQVRLTVSEGTALLSGAAPAGRTVLAEGLERCWAAQRADLAAEVLLSSSRGFFSETSFPNGERIDGLRRAAAELGDGHPALRARLVAELAAELTWHPDGDARFQLSDEALDIAASVRDNTTLAHVLVRRQLTIAAADTLELRRQACDELLEVAEQVGDLRLLFDAYFQRSGPAVAEGDIATIRSCLHRARLLADEAAQPHLQWLVQFSEAALQLFVGDLHGATMLAEAAVNLGRDANVGFEATAFYREQTAEISRLRGDLASEVDRYRRALIRPRIDPVHATLRYGAEAGATEEAGGAFDEIARVGFPIRRDLAQRAATDNLLVVALALGRIEEAQHLSARLEPVAHTFGHGAVAHPCGHHYIAAVAASSGNLDRALEHFRAAAAIHERSGVALLLAETLVEWRLAALHSGDIDLAADLQRRALNALAGRGAAYLEARAEITP